MERGMARQPTMEQRALAKLTTKERAATLGYSLTDVQALGRMMSSRHWAQPDEFDEANRRNSLNSRSVKKQLMLANQAANNPKADPLMNAWEDRRRSTDAEMMEMRKDVGGARLASKRGTGFYSEQKYKMTGYTGFIPAVREVVENTPVLSQEEAFKPTESTFLYERNKAPVNFPSYNYCNDSSIYKKGLPLGQAENLWPNKQESPRPQSATENRPQEVHIVHGDRRIRGMVSGTTQAFRLKERPGSAKPLPGVEPTTVTTIESNDVSEIKKLYLSSQKRVSKSMLQMILKSMRQRIEAKIDVGSNCTAFHLRKLFKRFDHNNSGMIGLEEFRSMLESFGIQFSEDETIVVFAMYDKWFSGEIHYPTMMKELLDDDRYQMYKAGINLKV